MNTYGYVGGDPVNYIDSDGLRKIGRPGVADNLVGKKRTSFSRGFNDFFAQFYETINPYDSGSCKYKRRGMAVELATLFAATAPMDVISTKIDAMFGNTVAQNDLNELNDFVLSSIENNKGYIIGKYVGSAINTGIISLIPPLRGASLPKRIAGGMAINTGAMSYTSFKALIEKMEGVVDKSNVLNCSCD